MTALWHLSWRSDPRAVRLYDRHYSRGTVGAPNIAPPGRCLVLVTPAGDAVWCTSWQRPEFVKHAWPGAWLCTVFRNEGPALSSDLIRAAVAHTRWAFGAAPVPGMVTFVDAGQTRRKRDPGRCFVRAGFARLARQTEGGLVVLQLLPAAMPHAAAPVGSQGVLAL